MTLISAKWKYKEFCSHKILVEQNKITNRKKFKASPKMKLFNISAPNLHNAMPTCYSCLRKSAIWCYSLTSLRRNCTTKPFGRNQLNQICVKYVSQRKKMRWYWFRGWDFRAGTGAWTLLNESSAAGDHCLGNHWFVGNHYPEGPVGNLAGNNNRTDHTKDLPKHTPTFYAYSISSFLINYLMVSSSISLFLFPSLFIEQIIIIANNLLEFKENNNFWNLRK